MKKILKWTMLVLGVLVVLFVVTPVFLPRTAHVERETVINRSPEEVFAVVSDFNQSRNWDPWAEADPTMKSHVTGSGVGSTYEWNGDTAGQGRSTLISAESPRSVQMQLRTFTPMDEEFTTAWRLEPSGSGTRAIWSLDQDLSYFTRYVGLCMDMILGPPFEKGLANLKAHVEK